MSSEKQRRWPGRKKLQDTLGGSASPRAKVGMILVMVILLGGVVTAFFGTSLTRFAKADCGDGQPGCLPSGQSGPGGPRSSRVPTASLGPGEAFVSTLPFLKEGNGFGPVERDRANGGQNRGDGNPLTMRGVRYPRGLGVHADSDVQINLAGRCTRFTATVGVDDEAQTDVDGRGTKVVFVVQADGKPVYRSPLLSRSLPPRPVSLDVSGAQKLNLVVEGFGYTVGDRADWGDARVTCRSTG